jgi:hypothetical protein
LWGNLKERGHLKYPGIDGKNNIEMDLQELGCGMDWIDLAQNRDGSPAIMNAVMNIQVP